MDEQQNVALIQKMYDAFGRGDIQTIVERLANDTAAVSAAYGGAAAAAR